jgi:predicted ATPase
MLQTVAIRGYRSLREVVLPLGRLSIVTGANGAGKSSCTARYGSWLIAAAGR